jgi:hypothetical protein
MASSPLAVSDDEFELRSTGMGSGADVVEAAEEKAPLVTRQALLNLLDSQFSDEASQSLARSIRDASVSPLPALRELVNRVMSMPKSTQISRQDWQRAQALFCLEALTALHRDVVQLLLDILMDIEAHIAYWRSKRSSGLQLYLQKGPEHWWETRPRAVLATGLKPWFSYIAFKQRTEIDEILSNLIELQEKFLDKIGELYRAIQFMSNLDSLERSIDEFEHLGLSLAAFLRFVPEPQAAPTGDSNQFLQLLHGMVDDVPDFRVKVNVHLRPLQKPSHLRRYWLTYVVGFVAVGLAGRYLYERRETVLRWVAESRHSLALFFDERVVQPIVSIYQYVFRTLTSRQTSATEQTLADSRRHLAAMLRDYGEVYANELASVEGVTVEEFRRALPQRAAQGDMGIVMNKYRKDVERPVRQALSGELVRGMLLQVQKVKVDSEATILALNQVLDSNAINFQLMALVPAVFATSATVYGVHWFVIGRRRRARAQAAFSAMRECLRNVENIFIRTYSSQPSNLDIGRLLQQLYRLDRAGVGVLSQTQRLLLHDDVQQLQAFDLRPEQKLLIVSRMYRTYPFLSAD